MSREQIDLTRLLGAFKLAQGAPLEARAGVKPVQDGDSNGEEELVGECEDGEGADGAEGEGEDEAQRLGDALRALRSGRVSRAPQRFQPA